MDNLFANNPVDISRWGKPYTWNNKIRSEMEYFPVAPPEENEAWEFSYSEEDGFWHLGFEWDDPREVAGVQIVYLSQADIICDSDIRIEYWNTHWPSPQPERWQGARSAWIEVEDRRQGKWIWARGDVKTEGTAQRFCFDPLDVVEIKDSKRLDWAEEYHVSYRKTLKVRVAVRGEKKPAVSQIKIISTAGFKEGEVDLYFGVDEKDADWSGKISILNGEILEIQPLNFENTDVLGENFSWKINTKHEPKGIRIKFLKMHGSTAQGDQTVLSAKTKSKSFSFLANDLDDSHIYIKPYGVLISLPLSDKNEWKDKIKNLKKGFKPIYNEIESQPEQSYERAKKEIPPLDVTKQAPYGRYVILGWEGVLQKFALRYNGEIFADKAQVKMTGRATAKIKWAGNSLHFRFGTGDPVDFRLGKEDSTQWLPNPAVPIYKTQWLDREIEYTQTAFGTLANGAVKGPHDITGDEELVAMARLNIRNTTEGQKKASVLLDITPAEHLKVIDSHVVALGRVTPAESVKDGWQVQTYHEPRYRTQIDIRGRGSLKAQSLSSFGIIMNSQEIDHGHFVNMGEEKKPRLMTTSIPNVILYEVVLDGFSSHEIDIKIPFTTYRVETAFDKIAGLNFDDKHDEVSEFWTKFNESGAKIQVPDQILTDVTKAVPWHILMTASKDFNSGNYIAPAGTYAYDVCGNEACMQTRLLDLLGYHDYARCYLDTFVKTQGAQMPDGNFKSQEGAFVAVSFDYGETQLGIFGYNLDHGYIMSAFAEHYFMTRDDSWLSSVAQSLVKACDFVIRERKATMHEAGGEKTAEFGLLPMGHLEDNFEWHYWFAVNGQAYGGMYRVGKALKSINHPKAEGILKEAESYKIDILNALDKAIEGSPVVKVPEGYYIPHVPTRINAKGRDWGWFREVGYGALHLVDGLVLDANDERVDWILQDQEDNLFISRSYGRAVDLEKYWFSHGGVTVQANVLNNGLAYLERDQTAHAIRSLYNNFGQHIYPDVLAFSEHPVAELGSGFGPFFKTPDESQFLVWLRNYLLCEAEGALWICKGAPRKWYADKKEISCDKLKTAFGAINFNIVSQSGGNRIKAVIHPPKNEKLNKICLRIRNHEGKKIRNVFVNGEPHFDYDASKEIVVLSDLNAALNVAVEF